MQNSCLINLRSPGCTKPTFIPVRTFLELLCHHLHMSLVSSKQENRNHSISNSKSLILGNGYRGSGTAQDYPGTCKVPSSLRAGTGLHVSVMLLEALALLLRVGWSALSCLAEPRKAQLWVLLLWSLVVVSSLFTSASLTTAVTDSGSLYPLIFNSSSLYVDTLLLYMFLLWLL